ncbi:hypothetical protein ACLB2K_002635 [Fragaria x ananassa]
MWLREEPRKLLLTCTMSHRSMNVSWERKCYFPEERHRLVVELEEVIRRLEKKFAENVEHEDHPYLELEDIRELEEAIPRLEENFRPRNQGPRVASEELGYYLGKSCIAKLKGAIKYKSEDFSALIHTCTEAEIGCQCH